MAGLVGIDAETMEQVDALRKVKPQWPHGLPFIRPTVLAPVLVPAAGGGLEAVAARFGFTTRFSSFNARDDRLTTSPVWKPHFGKEGHHALVALTYVVEWVREGKTKKPFLLGRADGGPLMAPALVGHHWERKEERAFALVTRPPSRFFAHFHDRMICAVTPDLGERWLDPQGEPEEALRACLRAPEDGELVATPAEPNLHARKEGDWSPIRRVGKPLTWEDVRRRADEPKGLGRFMLSL